MESQSLEYDFKPFTGQFLWLLLHSTIFLLFFFPLHTFPKQNSVASIAKSDKRKEYHMAFVTVDHGRGRLAYKALGRCNHETKRGCLESRIGILFSLISSAAIHSTIFYYHFPLLFFHLFFPFLSLWNIKNLFKNFMQLKYIFYRLRVGGIRV